MAVPQMPPASSARQSPLPTLTSLLYRLASGSVTSVELVRQSLDAIEASQPTLNAFRVVLRRQALADAAMLADELPNATFVKAKNILEWRFTPERLNRIAAGFALRCWAEPRSGRRRTGA